MARTGKLIAAAAAAVALGASAKLAYDVHTYSALRWALSSNLSYYHALVDVVRNRLDTGVWLTNVPDTVALGFHKELFESEQEPAASKLEFSASCTKRDLPPMLIQGRSSLASLDSVKAGNDTTSALSSPTATLTMYTSHGGVGGTTMRKPGLEKLAGKAGSFRDMKLVRTEQPYPRVFGPCQVHAATANSWHAALYRQMRAADSGPEIARLDVAGTGIEFKKTQHEASDPNGGRFSAEVPKLVLDQLLKNIELAQVSAAHTEEWTALAQTVKAPQIPGAGYALQLRAYRYDTDEELWLLTRQMDNEETASIRLFRAAKAVPES